MTDDMMFHLGDLCETVDDVPKPGETLAEALEERVMSCEAFAELVGLSKDEVDQILVAELPITTELAESFERVLGVSKEFWISLQRNYELEVEIVRAREEGRGHH